MNTEINFLKREPSKWPIYLILFCVFALLLSAVLFVLATQKAAAEKQITDLEKEISHAENELMEKNAGQSDAREMKELEKQLSAMEAEMVPSVLLYEEVLKLFEDPRQLLIYEMNLDKELTIELSYGSLQELADFIKQLADEAYIEDVILESSVKAEDVYSASLSIKLDEEMLAKEFMPDEG